MVIEDNRTWSSPQEFYGGGPESRPIAGPVDRLAAAIVDIFILYVSGSLILAPFYKKIREAQLVDQTEDMILAAMLMLLVMGLVSVVYQFVMTAWKGATVGKLIFGLRVVDVWTGKKSLSSNLFVRSSVWWIDSVLFAIPHMAVFADPLRRPLHDRVANTVVISIRSGKANPPKPAEMLLVKSFLVAFYVLGFVAVLQEVRAYYAAVEADQEGSLLEMMSPVQCESVTEAEELWPEERGQPAERISIALAMYAAGMVDEECLNREAFMEFKSGRHRELGYLARAFATSDESDLSDRYLEKVCEADPDSEPCLFSQVITDWTNRDWSSATVGFGKLLPRASVYVKVWAIKHFEKIKEFEKEMALIDELWPLPGLSTFLASHRTVGYWGLGRHSEARATVLNAIERASQEKQLGLAGWMCYQELTHGCPESLPPTCGRFEKLSESYTTAFSHELYAVAHLRVAECTSKFEYSKFEEEISNESVLSYAKFLEGQSKGQSESLKEDLLQLLEEVDRSGPLMNEVSRRALANGDKEILARVKDIWESSDESELWDRKGLGVRLVEAFNRIHQFDDAIEIGLALLKKDESQKELRDHVVIAAYGNKNYGLARKWLNSRDSGRSPARVNEIERIRRELEGRGH